MIPSEIFFRRMEYIFDSPDRVRSWYDAPHGRGMRINTLRLSADEAKRLGFACEPVPFSPAGFRLTDPDSRPGRSPWHHCGAIYMQEPSAMSAVTALDPQPGERVLDMCAAPGGKTTQIAAAMGGKGLLFANEYIRSRANILVSNIERMGIANCVVTSLHPDVPAGYFPMWFDRVLVDAPCSGEGMFRREEAAVTEWSPEHVRTCAARQRGILHSAAQCVAEGGVLVYSTCTFAPEENELTVAAFLSEHPDFRLEKIDAAFGRSAMTPERLAAFMEAFPDSAVDAPIPEDITLARRIFPDDGGEGHFVARLRRSGTAPFRDSSPLPCCEGITPPVRELLEGCFDRLPEGYIHTAGDTVYLLPCPFEELRGMPVVRAGVPVGTVEKRRIEPHHALFMSAAPSACKSRLELEPDDPRLDSFLHGQQLNVPDHIKGYTAVLCGGIITGFGKASGGALKNRYPKGLRLL